MKKIAYSLMALALAAFTFTSCEDVPAPFDQPTDPSQDPSGEVIEPTGDGTAANPFNVAAAIEKCKEIGDVTPDASSPKYYVKGIVTQDAEVTESEAQYGNITFTISDNGSNTNKFTAFQVYGLNNKKLQLGYKLTQGTEVVVYGPIYNFRGNTPETAGKGMAYIYSINGEGGGETPSGETIGSKDAPISTSEALTMINALSDGGRSTSKAYVKGKIIRVATNAENFAKYGNINYWISDDGTENNQVQVYAGDGLNGAKFNSVNDIAAGDEVVVFGTLYKYKNNNTGAVTPEIEDSYLVSLTKGETPTPTPTPSGEGEGSEANPYNVPAAIAKADQAGVFVKAYIVGWVDGQVYESGCNFNGNASSATNLLIAESADETDPAKCMPVQLPAGAVRTGLNLQDNPDNYKKEVLLYGDITTYFRVPGLKNTKYAKIGSTEYGTKPSGDQGSDDPTPSGSGALDINFTSGQGDWTIADIKPLSGGISYVWKADNQYGMKASAYVSGTRYETDSWLISPVVSLANGGTLVFEQTQRFAASGCTDLHIMVSTSDTGSTIDTSKWTEITPDKWPAGTSWDFITSKATLPAGTVRVAFRYTSTTSTAATWEIKTVKTE